MRLPNVSAVAGLILREKMMMISIKYDFFQQVANLPREMKGNMVTRRRDCVWLPP